MGSALDAFRAQQQAAEQIQARLTEVAGLLGQLRSQADSLAGNEHLRAVLRQEESWLESARRTVAEVRHWRQEEQKRYWPGVMKRWVVVLVFALVASAAAGAGYGWSRIRTPPSLPAYVRVFTSPISSSTALSR